MSAVTRRSLPKKGFVLTPADEVPGLVSTVITCYNKAPYLAEAIESALMQDYTPHEVVVVDDGSTDESPAVAQSFGTRIRLIRQANAGASAAKNRGIREARGEFVAFLDGDDRWLPGKLSKQMPLFARNPRVSVVYADRVKFSGTDTRIPEPERRHLRFHRGRVLDQILLDDFVSFSTAVVRRASLLEVGLLNENQRISDDYDLWLRVARCYEFDYVDEVLVEYRAATGGLSESGAENLLHHVLEIQERFAQTYFGGRYPNRAVWRRSLAGKYAAHAARHLVAGRHRKAIGSYLRAIWSDPSYLPPYYYIFRSMVPHRVVDHIKSRALGRPSSGALS